MKYNQDFIDEDTGEIITIEYKGRKAAIVWWRNLHNEEKKLVVDSVFGPKVSYKKMKGNQIIKLFKEYNDV